MTAVATQAAVSRLAKPIPGVFWIAATALTVSTAATLAYVDRRGRPARPWWEPQYIIPIAGMILGNSMTSAALAGDRLQGDLAARRRRWRHAWPSAFPGARPCSRWSALRCARR